MAYHCTSGELSGPGAELLIRFHTSKEERKRYTILTHGDTDTVVALLGKKLQVFTLHQSYKQIPTPFTFNLVGISETFEKTTSSLYYRTIMWST